jgi:hypothetical protein
VSKIKTLGAIQCEEDIRDHLSTEWKSIATLAIEKRVSEAEIIHLLERPLRRREVERQFAVIKGVSTVWYRIIELTERRKQHRARASKGGITMNTRRRARG